MMIDSLHLPCKPPYDKGNDEEHKKQLIIMEKEKKQESSLLFEDNQWKHTSKATIWNEACFLITNRLEKTHVACLP